MSVSGPGALNWPAIRCEPRYAKPPPFWGPTAVINHGSPASGFATLGVEQGRDSLTQGARFIARISALVLQLQHGWGG